MSTEPEPPTPEEQAAMEARMRAPKTQIDPEAFAQFKDRLDELGAALTDEKRKREDAERRALDAETKLKAAAAGTLNLSGRGRQLPIWYTISDYHVQTRGDITRLLADINEDSQHIPGFVSLTVGDFLALNTELLDAEAKARGFNGARWASKTDDGTIHTGYHLFVGTQVLVGLRDTAPSAAA